MAVQTDTLERYAELAVRVGANVAEGQYVAITGLIEHAPLVRALAREAWQAGASYVDVQYGDNHVRRALIELAPEEALTFSSPGGLARLRHLGEVRGASIGITGDPDPQLLDGLSGTRIGRARPLEAAKEGVRQLNARLVNWTGIAYPNEGWAETVFGEPDVDRLWDAVAVCTRLDDDDPVAAWASHLDELERRAAALNSFGVDEVRFRGPGTDLTIGLLPASRWHSARFDTSWGRPHVPNIPTEEVFTTPDRSRTEGTVRSTRPLALGGTIVRDLELTFAAGRVVDVGASEGREIIEAQLATDDGAPFLGEVALVDGESRVGRTGLTFFDVLYDENAACHIAYGAGLRFAVDGEPGEGFNDSVVHTDFMIGGPDVDVDVVTEHGSTLPVLRNDAWVVERR